MSKQFEFAQTSIPGQFSINLMDRYYYGWMDVRTSDLYRAMFTAIADILKSKQDKNKSRIGFILKDDKGVFKLGAVLNYRKPDEGEEDDSGNWYLEFTLYPEDMGEMDYECDSHSGEFLMCAQHEVYTIVGGTFKQPEFMHNIFNTAIDTLVDWLDANATESDVVEVVMRSTFTAAVAVENGKKVMSIVPGETIKQIVKGDSIL